MYLYVCTYIVLKYKYQCTHICVLIVLKYKYEYLYILCVLKYKYMYMYLYVCTYIVLSINVLGPMPSQYEITFCKMMTTLGIALALRLSSSVSV